MKLLFSIIITTLMWSATTIGVSGQGVITKKDLDKKSLKTYQKSISQSRKKDFKGAIKSINKVLKKYPTYQVGHLKKSGFLYNAGDLEGSIAALDEAIAISPEADPEMYFSKGIIHKSLKQYNRAAFNFDMFLARVKDGPRRTKARMYFDQTSFADAAIKNPVPYKPKKLSGDVNTSVSEYIPVLTMDSQQMIFTRRVGGQEDLYIAHLEDSSYVNAEGLDAINTLQNEGVHTISADGKRIIFTACNRQVEGIGGCDLFTTRLVDGEWSIPSNLGPVINTPAWEAQPTLAADGYSMYWSSNRKYGLGGNDIWMSTRTDTSGWTQPIPLSDAVNSTANDESPFLHPDGKTLYFRSNRSVGMGGYDIFYARYNDTTQTWNPARNLGYPINTEHDEGAMSVSLDGKTAYFATDQNTGLDGTKKNLDIYTFDLYEEARPQLITFVKAKIVDAITKIPIDAKVEIINLSESNDVKSGRTGSDGEYLNSLVARKKYAFYVSAKGYIYKSEHFDLSEVKTAYDPYVLNIELERLPIATIESQVEKAKEKEDIILENIFFETGSANLNDQSNTELDKLAELINDSENMKIEISGHTDNVGSPANNLLLSQKRAKSVVDALILRGVSPVRLSFVGYGETKPMTTNETEEGRQKNRRTTFKII